MNNNEEQQNFDMEDVFLNSKGLENTPEEEQEFSMQLAKLESAKFIAEQSQVAPLEPHDNGLAEKYESNRSLEKNQIRNFWYTKNHELGASFSSNHYGKNAEELYKVFSSGAKKDEWHASVAESCAYRNMAAQHKIEAADTSVDNYSTIEAQHKVEVALFDVYKSEMKGQEPDTTDLDQAYEKYEKVTERAARKERIAQRAADRGDEPASVSTRDTTKVRSPHAQVRHVDVNSLETALKQKNRLSNYQGKIASLRSQYNQ